MPAFRQQVQAFIDAKLSPAARSRILAQTARDGLKQLIASGQASPTYQTFVDGTRDDNEDDVRGDGSGRILYRFDVQAQAATFALAFLQTRSPVASGEYRSAIWVGVNGLYVRAPAFDPSNIPAGAEVTIVDTAPYARKVESGHMRMSVPRAPFQDARQVTQRRFPAVSVEATYVFAASDIGGGYVLRGRFRKGFRAKARKKLGSDTAAGADMTYPALVLTPKY